MSTSHTDGEACPKNNRKPHEFERLKHNEFDKCIHCGEPRFVLVARNTTPEAK